MDAAGERLRLLHVHAHPDDESSKGAATTAKYVAEGVEVVVATCTGGERGSILNPAMDRPDVLANIGEIRRAEMDRAREILGIEQVWLGFVDSGLPEGDPLPPLPDGCFAPLDLEVAVAPLVKVIRQFRPHVMTTYDENGGYPHPDHIMCHKISVAAFDAAADPDAYPELGAAVAGRRSCTTTSPSTGDRIAALEPGDDRARPGVAVRRAAARLGARPRARGADHHPGQCAEYFAVRDQALLAHATQVDPGGSVVLGAAGHPPARLADRGLAAGPQPGRRASCPRTTCSPGSRCRADRARTRAYSAGMTGA